MSKPRISTMPFITVEQVLKLRNRALELEDGLDAKDVENAELRQQLEMHALPIYKERTAGCEPDTPLERLRFFCSLSMNGQNWLDVEEFFDAVEEQLKDANAKLAEYEKQEPVAYMFKVRNTKTGQTLAEFAAIDYVERPGDEILSKEPLYTHAAPVPALAPGEVEALRKDADRFNYLQSIHPSKSQAFFWNFTFRKERAKAIDRAIDASKRTEEKGD